MLKNATFLKDGRRRHTIEPESAADITRMDSISMRREGSLNLPVAGQDKTVACFRSKWEDSVRTWSPWIDRSLRRGTGNMTSYAGARVSASLCAAVHETERSNFPMS